jgi:hypothetical protein
MACPYEDFLHLHPLDYEGGERARARFLSRNCGIGLTQVGERGWAARQDAKLTRLRPS